MYRVGLGDCFLLSFHPGAQPVHLLLDCGTLGTSSDVTMTEVVEDIGAETGWHLHGVIVTHPHRDHVSGFVTERRLFDRFSIDRVWLSWTENPHDPEGARLARYRADLRESIALAVDALQRGAASWPDEHRALQAVAARARNLLAFAGDLPAGEAAVDRQGAAEVEGAMTYVAGAGRELVHPQPGDVIEPPWLPGVRVYVLGPPRDLTAIVSPSERRSPGRYRVSSVLSQSLSVSARFCGSDLGFPQYRDTLDPAARQAFERTLPFDPRFRLEAGDAAARDAYMRAYDAPDAAWRRVDHDWLASADDLAVQLDNATNNTSLALAIELVADGRVLLLPGDAQLASWASWKDLRFQPTNGREVRVEDLLRRTAFFKVAHHATSQGTLAEGLEWMQRADLLAAIPVDERVAASRHPAWSMPAAGLYTDLLERTRGRVVRSDLGRVPDEHRPPSMDEAGWTASRAALDVDVTRVYIDIAFS